MNWCVQLISRFWTLIGNVQPGGMKDCWILQCERLEDTNSLQFILDPDFTCLQRYNGMLRYAEPTAGNTSQSSHTRRKPKELSREQKEMLQMAEERFINTCMTDFQVQLSSFACHCGCMV